jgi:hypothetical protein
VAWFPEAGAVRPKTPLTLEDARRVVGAFVEEYNTRRLHSAIGYVTPHDRLEGRHVRDRKLEAARERRAAAREETRQQRMAVGSFRA